MILYLFLAPVCFQIRGIAKTQQDSDSYFEREKVSTCLF